MKYILTGIQTGAVIRLTYGPDALITGIDMSESPQLTSKQREWLLGHVPTEEAHLAAFAANRFNVQAEKVEITFELFYEAYGHKKGKNEAERAFNRLSAANRLRAYNYIGTYNRDLQINTWKTKMYPATYLNKKIWED